MGERGLIIEVAAESEDGKETGAGVGEDGAPGAGPGCKEPSHEEEITACAELELGRVQGDAHLHEPEAELKQIQRAYEVGSGGSQGGTGATQLAHQEELEGTRVAHKNSEQVLAQKVSWLKGRLTGERERKRYE